MATVSFGTNFTNSLTGFTMASTTSDADYATINALIFDDQYVQSPNLNPGGVTVGAGIVINGLTNSSANINGITSATVTGLTGTTIASLRPGMPIQGPNVTPGSTVVSVVTGAVTSVITLSQNLLASTANTTKNTYLAVPNVDENWLQKNGVLMFPGGRGQITLKPGDRVGVDSSGWPIVISAASLAFTGTNWSR